MVNDDMEVANNSMDFNRCNIKSDKSDGIKENDTILNKNLENSVRFLFFKQIGTP